MPDAAAPPAADPFANKRKVLLVVSIGVFMATLDGSIVNLSLPTIARDFRVDPTTVEAVVSSYLIAIAATLLLFGAIGDRIGRRSLYLAGMALFTGGSALCAFSNSMPLLVAFRVVQAIGGSMVFALGPAILTAAYPPRERGAALGAIGTAVAGGQTAGPVVGGVLLHFFGWPSIFLVNLPVGLFGYVLAQRVLSPSAPEAHHLTADGGRRAFDVPGAIVLPFALLLLMVAFELAPRVGAGSPLVLGAAAGVAVLLVVFRSIERKAAVPLVDLAALRNRAFASANVSALLSFITIGGVFLLLPFFMAGVLGYEAYRMGLLLLAVPAMIAAVSPFSGRLSDRIGARTPCAVGLGVASAAVFLLSTLSRSSNEVDIVWRLALFGLGMAVFQSPNNAAIMGAVERRHLGLAGGMLATMRTLGFAIGVAGSAALLAAAYAAATGGVPLPPGNTGFDKDAFVSAQQFSLLVLTVICAAGIAVSLGRPGGLAAARPRGAPDETPGAGAPTASSRGK
jgi:EmrB/QacA subfamily drug resistance transporter